ncbi:hypothetical protein, partial [Thalassovita sp.]|uniref:hypothetical protein n=1 Tax=Thalassovita sp. TaxID=1979401 RepID=UPI002B26A786
ICSTVRPSGALLPSAVWRPVVRLSAAGEGGSKVITKYPQAVFHEKLRFSSFSCYFPKYNNKNNNLHYAFFQHFL